MTGGASRPTMVEEARALAARHGFFHWEIGFPGVWSKLASAEPKGGFDAVYRQPALCAAGTARAGGQARAEGAYRAFDGVADLYVYFYEQGLRLLKPGGRMSYVVTNKWLKAGYAEGLRGLFAEEGWLEFVADFGHAKHFFPDADVFPCVLMVRKPLRGQASPKDTAICVIPRELGAPARSGGGGR